MKKKTAKKSIVSLALCAFACCIAGGISFLRGGDVKAAAATTPVYNTLEAFTIEEEGSIRTSDYNGIRFRTELTEDERAAIDALGLSNMQYGTLILPADYLGSQELTHATANILDIQTKKWQQEGTEWTSVLAGAKDANGEYTSLPESYNNRPLAARSYVTGIKDGVTVYYYTENTVVRSIGYVAHMEEQTQESVTDQVANISKNADIRVEFVNASQISANQSEPANGAVELISNKLPNSTDKMAVLTIGGVPHWEAEVSYTVAGDAVSVNGTTVTATKVGTATVTASVTYDEVEYTATRVINTDTFVGASDYKILISENAKTANAITNSNFANGGTATSVQYEKAAAELLQKIFAEATGVELPIVTSVSNGDKFISIGATTKASGKTVSTTKDTSAQVFVDGSNVYILGKTAPEAIYYGTHQFLTDTVGYEFLMENTYSYDGNTEVQAAATAYEPDIEYNVIQSDLRGDGVMDGYFMQDYTRDMIALGINKENQKSAFHQGVAHNSVLVLHQAALANNVASGLGTIAYAGDADYKYYGTRYNYSDARNKNFTKWYATNTVRVASLMTYERYCMIENPYYQSTSQPDPFALWGKNDEGEDAITTQHQYIPAELCYTAHNDSDARTAMITYIGNEMLAELAANPTRTRLGFSHMDHRHWCTCTYCKNQGNPSDNLLTFLLDLAAYVKKGLTEAGDGRAETFKISSLFYHATNQAFTKTYDNVNLKHVEIWFAESAADYTIPLTTSSNWNTQVLKNFNSLTGLGDEVDVLWWGYYGMVTQFYVPFDSFDAIRANYALAAGAGVDYMFNQMMMSNQNFARLKEYLMSKLAWNADVEDNEWNGWIESYFKGAYGDGWEKMYKYFAKDSEDTTFTSWRDWTTSKDFTNTTTYNPTNASQSDASIWHDDDLTSSGISKTVLQGWIDTIDQAINALDPNDPNYDTYYWNIKREKATPLYLMLYIYGENQADSTHEATSSFSEDGKTYVKQYGAEFLEIVNHWALDYYGEGRSINDFKSGIENVLKGAATTTVEDDQIVSAGSSFTLNHAAITAGDYTIRVIGENGVQTATATASAGSITIPATIAAGKTYIVELLSSAGNVIRFTNVHTRTENANHQVMAKTQYIFCDEQDLLLKDSSIKAGTTYTVKIDARQYTATSYVNGKLSVPIGQMAANTRKTVLCDDGTTTYEFNVICANPIRTAQELRDLGVGGKVYEDRKPTYNNSMDTSGYAGGNANSGVAGNDVFGYYVLANDIDCAGERAFAAGYCWDKSWFKGTFDGNGYTISNITINEGGIFGNLRNATIKNVKFTGVVYDLTLGIYAGQYSQQVALLAHVADSSTFENIDVQVNDYKLHPNGHLGATFVHTYWNENNIKNVNIDASGVKLDCVLGSDNQDKVKYDNVTIKAAGYNTIGTKAGVALDNFSTTGVDFQTVGLCITTEETEVRANGSLQIETNQEGVTYSLETEIEGVEINETTGELTVSNRVEIGTKITVIATQGNYSAKKTFTVIRALETYTAATQNIEMGHYLSGTTVVMPTTSATIDLSEIYDTYLAGTNVTVTCGDTTWYQGAFGSNSWTITLDESMKSWNGIKNFVFTSETNTCEYVITLPVNFVQGVIELDKDNVGSPTDLQAIMKSNMGGHYVLTSDLDMGGEQLKGWGVTPFTGVLDGNGYGIVNTQLNYGGTDGETNGYRPVLIVRNEGTVKNIRFEINGYHYTAGNSGRGLIVENVGTVSNVYMTLNLNYNAGLNLSGWGHGWDPSHDNETTWTGGLVEKNYGAIENAIVKVTKNDGITIKSEFIGALAYKNYASGTVTGYMISDIDTIEAVQLNEGTATVARYSAWNSELISNISSWTAPWDNLAYGVCFGNSMIYEDPNVSATNINKTVTMSIKDGVVTLPNAIGGTIKSVTFNGVEIFVSADGNTMTFDGSAISTADLGANKTLIVKTSENKYQLQAIAVTDIITTADELRGLGVGKVSSQVAVTGYYVLGNDIDCINAEVFAAGSGIGGDAYFKGVFDGNNYTIKNIKVNTGGIFGNTYGATIKNVNFTGVIYDAVSYADTYGAWGNYTALLACNAVHTTFEKIDVQVAETKFSFNNTNEHFYEAVLFVNANGTVSVKDVTVDATGLALENVLGLYIDTENVTVNFENVLVKAASYSTIGYAAGVNADLANTDDEVKEWPMGVTFECVSSVTKNGDQTALDLPVYEGDVTELGFAAGTKVLTQYIANSSTAWSARTLTTTNSQFDYVDIQFSLSKSIGSLCVWMPGVDGNWTATLSGAIVGGNAPEHKIFILEADGSATSDTALAANKVYTLRVYLGIGEKGVSVSAFYSTTESVTIYYNSVATFGNEDESSVEELDKTVTIETYNNTTVTLPEDISGNVVAVTVGGVEIFNSATGYGSVSGNVITMGDDLSKSQSNLGEDKEMLVTMEDGTIYKLTANVYTMIINNAAELDQWQAVAADVAYMQGLVIEEQKKAVLSGYFALGNDILYNKVWSPILTFGNIWNTLDKTGSVGSTVVNDEKAIFEGWTEGNKAGFKGVFDGNGYKIDGMATSGQYSAFVVVMGGGTIKDVAFTNATIGATSSFVTDRGNGTIENVYVQVVSMASGNTGAGDNFTTVIKRSYSNYTTTLVDNVIVDFSAIGFAGLQYAYVADTGRHANNIYVIGVPETVMLNANYKAEGNVAVETKNYKDPFLFKELNLNANSDDGDDVKAFANAYALVADETYKANVTSWGDLWKIDENNALYFGSHKIYDGTPIIDLDETVTVSIKDGTFVLPTGVKGTVSSITLNGTEILTSISDGVVTFDKEVMPTDVAALGAGKTLIILTDTTIYNVSADVYTDTITTAEELKALGVGGKVGAKITIGNGAVAGQHKEGYYALTKDIDAADTVFAAGYRYVDADFKGVFDGNGYTIANVKVGEGGIFGSVQGGVIRNVNFVNVMVHGNGGSGFDKVTNDQLNGNGDNGTAGTGLNNNLQWGFYTAILGYNGGNTTVSDVNIQVSQYINNSLHERSALLFYKQSGATTIKNVTIDASGLNLSSVLGTELNGDTFTNVLIMAAGYQLIGCSAGESAVVNEWPAGVTYETVATAIVKPITVDNDGASLSVYVGDVTALGFAEGTKVYYQVQDNRTNMWQPGTNLGLSTENQGIRIEKAADEDYASVQFSISRAFTGTYAFFAWYYMDGSRTGGSVYVNANGTKNAYNGQTATVYDLEGRTVSSLEPGKAYEMRWYCEGATAFRVGCAEQNGESITVYYANPSSGNDLEMMGYESGVIMNYHGDETALGFVEGTQVYDYYTPDASVYGEGSDGWTKTNNRKIKLYSVDGKASFQFSLTSAFTGGSAFAMWPSGGGFMGMISTQGIKSSGDAGYEECAVVYDEDGNVVINTTFEVGKVYTVVFTVSTDKEYITVGTLETSEFHIYIANINAHVNV